MGPFTKKKNKKNFDFTKKIKNTLTEVKKLKKNCTFMPPPLGNQMEGPLVPACLQH